MAILSQDDEIGLAAVAWSEAGAEVEGIEVVYDEPFALDTTDFAPIVTEALASDPDIINLGACYPEFQSLICEQAYLQGWTGIVTSACWDFGAILAKVTHGVHGRRQCPTSRTSTIRDWQTRATSPPAIPIRSSGTPGKRLTLTAGTRRSRGNTPRA